MMKPIHIHWARVTPVAAVIFFCLLLIYVVTRTPSCGTAYVDSPDIRAVSYLCNHLTEYPTNGDEGSVPTFKYRLEQVHVTIRHGDRFHLHTLPNYDMISIPCNISNKEISLVPEMEGYAQTLHENAKKLKLGHPFFNWDLYPKKPVCKPSFLTPKGAAQHVRNGAFLKSVYVRKWKLLNHGAELWDQVRLISTKKGRTAMSGLALLYGLLPEFDLEKLNVTVTNDNRVCVPSAKIACDCPAVQRLLNVVSGVYGQWLAAFPAQKHVKKFLQEVSEVLGTPLHTLPFVSHIMDVSTVHMCHGLPLPGPPGQTKCFSPATVRSIIEALNQNGAQHIQNPKVQRLSYLKTHPLFMSILDQMESMRNGKTTQRFFLYSGHDSTIDPMTIVLNISEGMWPRYASRVVLELYSSAAANPANTDQQRDFFVKVVYDGKDVTAQTKGCSKLAEDGLCSFDNFKRALGEENERNMLGGRTYRQACSRPLT